MIENTSDRIPTRQECEELMASYVMLPNIFAHSVQVMRVSLAIMNNLNSFVSINRDLVVTAALLHDITKTRSLTTRERHDASGGELLRELGFPRIAEIVEQHVIIRDINLQGRIEEREIVYYADKRVLHDTIVTIDQRMKDILVRYGMTEETRAMILYNGRQALGVERKIASFMKVDIDEAIRFFMESSAGE
jgi:putative nucleotidyltransferase with HDIG domain